MSAMCFCALVAPCALCYDHHCKQEDWCCTCVDDACYEFLVLSLDDVDCFCCCVGLPLRYQIFDADYWCHCCAKEVHTPSAVRTPIVTAQQAVQAGIPVAISMA